MSTKSATWRWRMVAGGLLVSILAIGAFFGGELWTWARTKQYDEPRTAVFGSEDRLSGASHLWQVVGEHVGEFHAPPIDRIVYHTPRWGPNRGAEFHGPYREYVGASLRVAGRYEHGQGQGVWTFYDARGTIVGQLDLASPNLRIRRNPPWW